MGVIMAAPILRSRSAHHNPLIFSCEGSLLRPRRGPVPPEPHMPRAAVAALVLVASLPAAAQDIFASRPAFSPPDQLARRSAGCAEVRAMAEGLPAREERIDLSIQGSLTLVKTDGALWYLVMCDDLRIMCVTYQSNDMKTGERVVMQGGYRRLDDRHAVLDPCLASRDAAASAPD
jgi:hypothetical protein